jgi:hypothetical protein
MPKLLEFFSLSQAALPAEITAPSEQVRPRGSPALQATSADLRETSSVLTAKPPMRLNRPKAQLVPVVEFVEWHAQAIHSSGPSDTEPRVLDAIAAW